MENFIVPLTSIIDSSNSFLGKSQQSSAAAIPFKDVFQTALVEAKQTDEISKAADIAAATGDVDRLHDLTIASTKADMALKLFVSLRNKGHDAYSEIMRMGV